MRLHPASALAAFNKRGRDLPPGGWLVFNEVISLVATLTTGKRSDSATLVGEGLSPKLGCISG